MMSYWKDLAERVVASAAGAVLAILGAEGVNLLDLDLMQVLGVAGGAALISLLKGLAARAVGNPDSAAMLTKPQGE